LVTYVWQHWQPSLFVFCTMSQKWITHERRPVSYLCANTWSGFPKKHVQNLNTPQNNSVRWDLQKGFNSALEELKNRHAISNLSVYIHSFPCKFEIVWQIFKKFFVNIIQFEDCSTTFACRTAWRQFGWI